MHDLDAINSAIRLGARPVLPLGVVYVLEHSESTWVVVGVFPGGWRATMGGHRPTVSFDASDYVNFDVRLLHVPDDAPSFCDWAIARDRCRYRDLV
jgi:hypothetical protein